MARTAMAVVAMAVLALGATSASASVWDEARQAEAVEAAVGAQLTLAEAQYSQQRYDAVVAALAPAMTPAVFGDLTEAEQYDVLGLYARALSGLGQFDDAHQAFIDLTGNENATPADWAMRLETAKRVGDEADAAVAEQALQDAEDDADDWNVSIVA